MQKHLQRYYKGEYVLTNTVIRNGRREQKREYIENPLINQHISGRAAVIGNGNSRIVFDKRIQLLNNHTGGLLGSKSMQSYGTYIDNKICPKFVTSSNKEFLEHCISEKLDEDNLIFSNVRRCVEYPGHFFLIPHNPVLTDTVSAVYLACFHEHNEVYMLGFDQDVESVWSSQTTQLENLIRTYDTTEFIFVTDHNTVPVELQKHLNVDKITYREFVIQADV